VLRLCVEETPYLFILYLIQYPLKKFFEVVLAHYRMGQGQECFFRISPDFLTCIFQVVREDGDEFVGVFEK